MTRYGYIEGIDIPQWRRLQAILDLNYGPPYTVLATCVRCRQLTAVPERHESYCSQREYNFGD